MSEQDTGLLQSPSSCSLLPSSGSGASNTAGNNSVACDADLLKMSLTSTVVAEACKHKRAWSKATPRLLRKRHQTASWAREREACSKAPSSNRAATASPTVANKAKRSSSAAEPPQVPTALLYASKAFFGGAASAQATQSSASGSAASNKAFNRPSATWPAASHRARHSFDVWRRRRPSMSTPARPGPRRGFRNTLTRESVASPL